MQPHHKVLLLWEEIGWLNKSQWPYKKKVDKTDLAPIFDPVYTYYVQKKFYCISVQTTSNVYDDMTKMMFLNSLSSSSALCAISGKLNVRLVFVY